MSASVPDGANHYGMEFGAANVAIHAVSAAVELADGTLAVARAEQAERSGQLHARQEPRPSEELRSLVAWLGL